MSTPWIPANAQPMVEDRLNDPSRWFSRRFVMFMQTVFREQPPGQFHWSEQEEETEILITDEMPVRLDSNSKRMAIQLMTGGIQNQNLAINHLVTRNMLTGESTHMDLWSGQAVFNIHAFNDDEARALALKVSYKLQQQRWRLIRMADLHFVGHVVSYGPTSGPAALVTAQPGDEDSIMISVTFPFFYQEAWKRKPKVVPHGEHDRYTDGHGVREGEQLEDPPRLRHYLMKMALYRPGEFSRHEEEIKRALYDPRNVVTSRGQVLRVVRSMDAAREERTKRSPYVSSEGTIKEE